MIHAKIYELHPEVKSIQDSPFAAFDADGNEVLIPQSTLDAAQMLSVSDAAKKIASLYDGAMLKLQNGYSDQEVKTFTPKQDAAAQYKAGGLSALSSDNRVMLEGLAGSTDDAAVQAKLDNIVAASETFKLYLGQIEHLRDTHLDQLVDGQDNLPVVQSLESAYSALG